MTTTYVFMVAVALLMSTHNICFYREIRKSLSGYHSYQSGVMNSTWKRAKLRTNKFATGQLLIHIHILNDKQCRSRSVGF